MFSYLQERKVNSVALTVDLEKAFDSVNIQFLQSELQHMSFGSKFQNAIEPIYHNPSTKLRVSDLLPPISCALCHSD